MGERIAVIGGDARYLELIRQLQALPDVSMVLVGFDNLEQSFTGLKQSDLHDLQPHELDAVILPITGTDESGKIETVFSDQEIQLKDEWFQKLKKSAKIFTGNTSSYLTKMADQYGLDLIPLLMRDDVTIYNSIPTAEGAIMMAIEHTDYTIHSSEVVVTGFGRVGSTVANKFAGLGARVRVASRNASDLARITEMNFGAIQLEELSSHLESCDLLINTIPAPVITQKEIEQLPAHTVIIDLASKPGGTDFEFANRRGIKAILAKSLPGVVAPKTAGKILANVIMKILDGGGSS